MRFSAAEGSRLVVCALARRIEIQAPSEGTVSIGGPAEVLANVENGAPVVVIEDATCTCEPEKTAVPLLTRKGAILTSNKAIVIVVAGAAAAGGGVYAATKGGGETRTSISTF